MSVWRISGTLVPPVQDGPDELADEDGVVAAVVDVAGPEHRVLHLAHQRVGGVSQGFGAVRHRHLVDRRAGPAVHDVDLHADLAVGIVEAERAECLEPIGAAGVPRLGR